MKSLISSSDRGYYGYNIQVGINEEEEEEEKRLRQKKKKNLKGAKRRVRKEQPIYQLQSRSSMFSSWSHSVGSASTFCFFVDETKENKKNETRKNRRKKEKTMITFQSNSVLLEAG